VSTRTRVGTWIEKNRPDVRLEVALELCGEAPRRSGGSRVATEPLGVWPFWRVPPVQRPPGISDVLDLLLPAGQSRHPRRLLRGQVRRLRVDEDERPRSVGVHSGKERGNDRGLVGRENRRLLRANRLHDHEDVIRERLDVGDITWSESLRAPPASAVGDDKPRVPGEPTEEPCEVWALPVHVDLRAVTLEVDEIDRAIPDNLVGERHVAVPGKAGHGPFHRAYRPARAPVPQVDRPRVSRPGRG
jgi:hypothetical protein